MRGLESFITKNRDKQIAKKIDILYEIDKWRRAHGKDPVIVIDLKEVNRVLQKIDEGGLILGGRFDEINEIIEYFFDRLRKCKANLVSMACLYDDKYTDIDVFLPCFAAYDCIEQKKSLKNHLTKNSKQKRVHSSDLRPNERIWYNLQRIAAKYGQLYSNYGLNKLSIISYTREKRDEIMAVITRDTKFFVFDVDFEYWSLSDIGFNTFKIDKFSRQKLKEALNLNTRQMQLVSAISDLNQEDKIKLVGKDISPFLGVVKYVEEQQCQPNGYDVTKLPGPLTRAQRKKIQDDLSILNKFNRFSGGWRTDIYSEPVASLTAINPTFTAILEYFREAIPYVYKLVDESLTVPKDLLFIDVRNRWAQTYIDLVLRVTMKMIGIAFKDVAQKHQPKTRAVKIKRRYFTPSTEQNMNIIYPTILLPSLGDLLVNNDDHSIDDARWGLLKWLLEVEDTSLSQIRTSEDSKYMRVVHLTLLFLSSNKIISDRESKAILRSEKKCETERNSHVSDSVQPSAPTLNNCLPEDVVLLWVQVCHKYTIAFELVCHCLEICGLRKETTLLQFNAINFHKDIQERMVDRSRNIPPNMQRIYWE